MQNEYRTLEVGEVIEDGDEYQAHDGISWLPADQGTSIGTPLTLNHNPYRRKLKQYRDLAVGEVIQEGDEINDYGTWKPATAVIGMRVEVLGNKYRYRRPLIKPSPADPLKCVCQQWHGELHLATHHPTCDGFGNHKPETELSLLVVDFGGACAVQSQYECQLKIGGNTVDLLPNEARMCYFKFDELRRDIDAMFTEDKPVPRIERDVDYPYEYERYIVTYRRKGAEKDTKKPMNAIAYNTLSELARQAGATSDLPIWTPNKTSWEKLSEEPVVVWRFTSS